ncbi:MAG TPA: hypothetical protein IGS52_12335 [Oscillatoriaceae cyanobacterium M33_DOE_052]|nr:hypothetical protein [Oscillatoriaceae cyanobacterium M33_DOE_052]
MSEADRPTNPSASASADATSPVPEPIDPSSPHLGDDEGWETVNLPNHISIAALEQQSDNSQETALALPFEGWTTPGGLATTTPEAWNSSDLVDRIAKLEIAIGEYRDRLGQDQARSDAQRQLLAQRTIELKAANEQIEVQNRHIEALEAQTTQQQSTIDSLTTEVESLSRQIAQIERECALTQHRYMQESQLRQKAEINAQELRSRLHRQQHHTLQFKAALEKCLEPLPTPDTATPIATASNTEPNSSIFPKAPSIQPWSAPVAETGRRGDSETGRLGDGETRRPGDPETGRLGDGETRRRGDSETGSRGAREQGSKGEREQFSPLPPSPPVGERSRTAAPLPLRSLVPQSPSPLVPQSPSPLVPQSPVSPSPLVYPKDANVKKRRSLAAVQLPNFAT